MDVVPDVPVWEIPVPGWVESPIDVLIINGLPVVVVIPVNALSISTSLIVGDPVVIEIATWLVIPDPVIIRFSRVGEVVVSTIAAVASSVVLFIVNPDNLEFEAPVTTVAVVCCIVVTSGPLTETMST